MKEWIPLAPATRRPSILRAGMGLAIVLSLTAPSWVMAQAAFDKPEAAADALINAIAANDGDAMAHVLGKDWKKLAPLNDGDPEDKTLFLEKTSQARKLTVQGNRAELAVGSDPWTLPVPLVQSADGQWRFDAVAGREAILERRIGANERAAMRAVLAYVDAQREYAAADRNGDGLLEYAQKLVSSAGRRDGLIWSTSLGDESPLGEDYLPSRAGAGYHGYRYKILTSQGPSAQGGARNYVIGKRMTAGFALLAWPVKYGETGVMSFMVGSDGTVFQRDLGPGTARAASDIRQFNPDDSWTPTQP
ncbi:MAG: DUF2950 domain-containing protein [Rubrivivax sp.]|nr:DUF2950 domain-containing protein [Rubrivivax sp.]